MAMAMVGLLSLDQVQMVGLMVVWVLDDGWSSLSRSSLDGGLGY